MKRLAMQVRFSRHLLLTALQVGISLAATASTSGFTWEGALPLELTQALGCAAVPAAGLYFVEAAARRTFVGGRTSQHND